MWIILSFLASFLETSKDILSKKSSLKIDNYITAFSLQLFSTLTLLPIILFTGIPPLKTSYWIALVGFAIGIPLWSLLYMRALKLSPLSVTIPMLAFNPVFTALLSILFDHRFPNSIGWTGIILITSGIYLLRLDRTVLSKGIYYPFLQILKEPGALAMLGVALIWSIGAHINKLGVTGSSPLFAAFSGCLVATIVLFIIAKLKTTVSFKIIKNNFKFLGTIGILNGLSELALFTALSQGFTAYIISIKRTNILWSSIIGSFIFNERLNKLKIIALLVMLLGVVLIITS